MSVSSVPAPTSGPSPFVMPETAGSAPPHPSLTPNPYGIPDSIVLDSARSAHDGPYDALGDFFKASIGDDLTAASDGKQTPQSRLLHAGLAAATVLTLPAAPELFGLKLAAKQTIKGGIEQLAFHAVGDAAAKGGKLILHDGAQLNPAESKIASMFVARGHEVIAQSTSRIEGQGPLISSSTATRPNSRRCRTPVRMRRATHLQN